MLSVGIDWRDFCIGFGWMLDDNKRVNWICIQPLPCLVFIVRRDEVTP